MRLTLYRGGCARCIGKMNEIHFIGTFTMSEPSSMKFCQLKKVKLRDSVARPEAVCDMP